MSVEKAIEQAFGFAIEPGCSGINTGFEELAEIYRAGMRDAMEKLDNLRVELRPEYGAGYVELAYKDQEFPAAEAIGATAFEALHELYQMVDEPCCSPTPEEVDALQRGDCTPQELWGGMRPTCPKCIGKDGA